MKNIVYRSMIMVLAVVTTLSACKKDDELKHTQVSPVNTLFAPANEAFVKLEPSNGGATTFEWEQARAEDGGLVLYEVVFDKADGDFSKPLFSYSSENNGMMTRLSLSHTELNKIANLAGIQSLQSGTIKWMVRSSKGINAQASQESRTLEVERPEGFSEIPAEVFLTGAATEGGADLAGAVKFKKTADGIFEIYTKLKEGSYNFAERNTGTPKTFSIANGKLVAEGTSTAAGAEKLYRIRLNFNSATAEMTEIVSLGLWFSPDNKIMFELPYTGKGVWTATNKPIVFKQEGWGRDERYKFRLDVKNAAGATVSEWLGSKNGDNQPATATTPASYFELVPVSSAQYDNAFKFNHAADNKSVDVMLRMNAEGVYTHTVTVK